jgi:hypothetical protein
MNTKGRERPSINPLGATLPAGDARGKFPRGKLPSEEETLEDTAPIEKPITVAGFFGKLTISYVPTGIKRVMEGNPIANRKALHTHWLIAVGLRALEERELRGLFSWIRESERTGNWHEKAPWEIIGKMQDAMRAEKSGPHGAPIEGDAIYLLTSRSADDFGKHIEREVDFELPR